MNCVITYNYVVTWTPTGRISGENKFWFSEVTAGGREAVLQVRLRSCLQQPYAASSGYGGFLTSEVCLDWYLFLQSPGSFQKVTPDCFTSVSLNSTEKCMASPVRGSSSHIVNLDPAFILKNSDAKLASGDTDYTSSTINLFYPREPNEFHFCIC